MPDTKPTISGSCTDVLARLADALPREPIASSTWEDFHGSLYVTFDPETQEWEIEYVDGKRNCAATDVSLPDLLSWVCEKVGVEPDGTGGDL